MNSKGITLLEVIIVAIIIGILAALFAVRGSYEINYGERAITNIELIASTIKMYYIKHNSYPSGGSGGHGSYIADLGDTLSNINQDLHLELVDVHFEYNILYGEAWPACVIVAERIDGTYSGNQISYGLNLASSPTMDQWFYAGDGDPAMDSAGSTWPWMPQN